MGSETIEVRLISRACAMLLALIVATLLSSVHLRVAPPTGPGAEFSMQIVHKRAEESLVAATASASAEGAVQAADSLIDSGVGMDVRLWLESPEGDLVFASAERYARCLTARAQGREDADCPSAGDRRRMVLDKTLNRSA